MKELAQPTRETPHNYPNHWREDAEYLNLRPVRPALTTRKVPRGLDSEEEAATPTTRKAAPTTRKGRVPTTRKVPQWRSGWPEPTRENLTTAILHTTASTARKRPRQRKEGKGYPKHEEGRVPTTRKVPQHTASTTRKRPTPTTRKV